MATSTAKPAGQPAAVAPGTEEMLTVLAGVLGRLVVKSSTGRDPATFRQIAVTELRIASHADVDAIEAWLTAHPRTS